MERQRSFDFGRDQQGVATIEFAFILPVLVVFWLALVEVTNVVSIDRKVHRATELSASLASSRIIAGEASPASVLQTVGGLLEPQMPGPTDLILTAVRKSPDNQVTILWSEAQGSSPARTDASSLPRRITQKIPQDKVVIVAESRHAYQPIVAYVFGGLFTIHDQSLRVAR